MITILRGLRSAAAFVWRRPKDAVIILLVLLAGILAWRERRMSDRAAEQTAKLAGLPPNTKQVITLYRDRVVTKWRDGPSKIEYRDRYLPPEGHVEIVSKVDKPEEPPEVVIMERGLTSRLGGGIVYAGEALPLLDLKWAYWQRYSLTLGLTPRFGGMGVSRHVDDLTPFGNLEILGMAGSDWMGKPRLGVGFRMNF